jgi:hypothetical protein
VRDRLHAPLAATSICALSAADNRMGASVSRVQHADVPKRIGQFGSDCKPLASDPAAFRLVGLDPGAFLPAVLLLCPSPDRATCVHGRDAWGLVATPIVIPDRQATSSTDGRAHSSFWPSRRRGIAPARS